MVTIRKKSKAELHLHLEGTLRPSTLLEIAPGLTTGEIQAHYSFSGFDAFLQSYVWAVRHLQRPEHYALALHRLLDELSAQQVEYAELTLSAGVILWRNQHLEEVWAALAETAAAERRVRIRWIPDAVRQFGPAAAEGVAEFAIRHLHQGVVALGIGGDEIRGPARQFQEIYAVARQAGLRLVAHAGEVGGPESIWQALEIGAERIGHGIRAIDDPVLVEHLRTHKIPLEVCISSNVATGAVSSLAAHPVRRLYDAGVPITLNTDDPAMFGTTFDHEFEIARQYFGFTGDELDGIRENAWRFAFDAAES